MASHPTQFKPFLLTLCVTVTLLAARLAAGAGSASSNAAPAPVAAPVAVAPAPAPAATARPAAQPAALAARPQPVPVPVAPGTEALTARAHGLATAPVAGWPAEGSPLAVLAVAVVVVLAAGRWALRRSTLVLQPAGC